MFNGLIVVWDNVVVSYIGIDMYCIKVDVMDWNFKWWFCGCLINCEFWLVEIFKCLCFIWVLGFVCVNGCVVWWYDFVNIDG